MPPDPHITVYAGFLIGLVFGVVGLLSGFCLMSSLRGYWGKGDGRLVRTYALAMGVAVSPRNCLPARASSILENRSICSRRSPRP